MTSKRIMTLSLLASMLLLTGCQKRWADSSWTDASYDGASLVFDSTNQQAVNVKRPEGVLPWYAGRRDYRPQTESGYVSQRLEYSRRISRDYNAIGPNGPYTFHRDRVYTVEQTYKVD